MTQSFQVFRSAQGMKLTRMIALYTTRQCPGNVAFDHITIKSIVAGTPSEMIYCTIILTTVT